MLEIGGEASLVAQVQTNGNGDRLIGCGRRQQFAVTGIPGNATGQEYTSGYGRRVGKGRYYIQEDGSDNKDAE